MTAKETLSDTPPSPVGAGLLAKASGQSASLLNEPPHSRASSLPQDDRQPRHRGAGDSGVRGMTAKETLSDDSTSPVGVSLLAKASGQSTTSLNDTPLSRAGSLLQRVSGPTLDFAEVSLTLGRTTILDNVTFQVQPGHVHALVGPNGGGKSSLIKTMLGQMPHQGRLSLNGRPSPGPSATCHRRWSSTEVCR